MPLADVMASQPLPVTSSTRVIAVIIVYILCCVAWEYMRRTLIQFLLYCERNARPPTDHVQRDNIHQGLVDGEGRLEDQELDMGDDWLMGDLDDDEVILLFAGEDINDPDREAVLREPFPFEELVE